AYLCVCVVQRKKFEPAGTVQVPWTVCVPSGGTLMDRFGESAEYAAAALYLTSLAKSTLSLTTGFTTASPVLTRCMFSTSDVPALKGSPTFGGMSKPTSFPDLDVA